MFTLVSGPFSYLESALVETVQQIKSADSRAPLAILVPSDSLRRRLQWLLCAEHSCALFDLHVLTFHQFVLHLHAEQAALGSLEAWVSPFELVGDFFYEYLLAVLLEKSGQTVGPFADLQSSSGLRQAVWRSIRDLLEAQVEPRLALRAVEEGLFDEIAVTRLAGLLKLQEAIVNVSRQLGVGLPEDLANSVIPWVGASPFVAKFPTIIYYGFYDITQVQLSLLEEVARTNSVKVFFPLTDQPAYQFAQRFLDRHLLKAGVVHQSHQVGHKALELRSPTVSSPSVQVVNVIGGQGELVFTCKAILHAVETTGHTFHEIGVVARTLEPYGLFLRRVFAEHRIPFCTTATLPLLEEPYAKLWWQLAGLKEERYPWQALLNVVTSPYYRNLSVNGCSTHAQKPIWIQAIRHWRLMQGREDWERLAAVANDPEAIADWQRKVGVPLEEASVALQQCADVVGRLVADCQALPESGSIGELTLAFEALVNTHLSLLQEETSSQMEERDQAHRESLAQAFEQVMTQLKQLDRVGTQVTWGAWVEVCRGALEGTRMPIPGQSPLGVQVFDAMAARGQSFKTVFILGMNDQVFPRVVREDAFLRDGDRRVLAESLGYKIDEKMHGFDEEALLFALLRHSARDRVYLVYQRADHKGRPLLPSPLLTECMRDVPGCSEQVMSVPLRVAERVRLPYFSPGEETGQETRLRYLLQGRAIQTASLEPSFWWILFRHGFKSVAALEKTSTGAGSHDGMMAVEGAHWQELLSRGLSPTVLERYAQCPCRYWMEHALHTRNVREPISREMPSRVWGELGHTILRHVYRYLIDHQWPVSPIESVHLSSLIASTIDQVCDTYASHYGKGYVVLWERMKTQLGAVVVAMIEHDQQEYVDQAMVPVDCEIGAEGEIGSGVPGDSALLKIHGRMDRVDRQSDGLRTRIVDYKFSGGLATRIDHPDLVNEALRGRRLQPPLYSLMSSLSLAGHSGEHSKEMMSPHPAMHSVEFRFIRPLHPAPLTFSSFPSSIWATQTGDQLLRTIRRWIEGIRTGQFFILPGPYCRDCAWSVACRFQHHPSWVRAYGIPLAKEFRQGRKQRATHE
ncbi:PD-(D/E)XK nuclease family protein [Nitrospira sp. T9]|uniref:PD-(D/E)XK nuclease family protein n=1 Tax=unclassified Nitrospira TaxID=2652172 RepID=UPI003F9A2679